MGYSRVIQQKAWEQLVHRRETVRQEAARRRDALRDEIPALFAIERELADTGLRTARAVLGSDDIAPELARLREQNLALQERYEALLMEGGYPADYLDPHPFCPHCGDTGSANGVTCNCLRELMRNEAYRQLNEMTPLALCDFASFDLRYYSDVPPSSDASSPRRQMEEIFAYCRQYADHFSPRTKSLLMQGPTGLGKTHLSLAIARAVIDAGYGAVYGSVQNLMARLERERFGRDVADPGESANALIACDLLILDDLGTEFTTSFITSCLYNIINSRLLAGRPTIISTNLSLRELEQKYTERFTSRIIGGYDRLVFMGSDVRQKKQMQSMDE